MKIFYQISIIILAFILVILDVSFFSQLDIYGASVLFSFIAAILFALLDREKNYLFYLLAAVLFFTIFSSLPLPIIFLNFFLLPVAINYVKNTYFPEPTIISVVFYFFISAFIFDFVILIYAKEWNQAGYLALGYFTVLNSLAGIGLFALIRRIFRHYWAREIKL